MKIFYIIGKSASGKDSIYKNLLTMIRSFELLPIVQYTTRPMRIGERDGVDYHFVTYNDFLDMMHEQKVIEARTYKTVEGNWVYFTAKMKDTGAGKVYLGIGTLESYHSMKTAYGDDVIPIYIDVNDETRLRRAIERESKQLNPNYKELCRRFIADCEDFSDERLNAFVINNVFHNYDLEECCIKIKNFIYGYILKHEHI